MERIIDRINKLTDKDPKNLFERTIKGMEEYGELAEAVLSYSKTSACAYKGKTKEDIVEEVVDVLLIVLAVAHHVDPSLDMEALDRIIKRKLDKWESKINK